jgi:CHASE2 domain-containing sensor protein
MSDAISLIMHGTPPYEQNISPYYVAILIVLGLIYGLFFVSLYAFLYAWYTRLFNKRRV